MSESRFVRAFGLVSGATALGQAVGLVSLPLLSRLYPASAFGEYGVFIAISTVLSGLACLRLDMAIPRADHESESEDIASAGMLSVALISVALMLLAALRNEPVAGIVLSRGGLLLLPMSVFVGGMWLLVNQLAIRRGRFRVVAAQSLVQSVVAFTVQSVWILLGASGPGLILGYMAGQGVAALTCLLDARDSLSLSLRRSWSVVRSHRNYILIMTPQSVLNSLNVQLPLLMVSWLYGVETTGFFNMAQRVMGVPIGLIGIAMGQVYVSFLVERKGQSVESAAVLFGRVSRALGLIGVALIVGSVLFARRLFGLVLGSQWLTSGGYAQVASPMYAAQLVASPLAATLVVMRRESVQAKWDVLRLVVLLSCLLGAWQLHLQPSTFVAVLTIAVTANYAALWLLCRRAVTLAVR